MDTPMKVICRNFKKTKEGNILFNDALNTFYLQLYGVRHMVKDHSNSERGNPPRHVGYHFRLAARVILYVSSRKQDNNYHGLCYTRRGALAGTRHSSMAHEGPIRQMLLPLSCISLLVISIPSGFLPLPPNWCEGSTGRTH